MSVNVDELKRQWFEYEAQLNQELGGKEPFKMISEKSQGKVKPAWVAVGGGSIIVITLWLLGQELLINLVGFAYPAYCSIRAIETPSANDDKQWLTYWVVYAMFAVLEFFADTLVYWMPFYYVAKLALLVYLLAPQTQGAAVIYNKVIRPYLVEGSVLENKKPNLGQVAEDLSAKAGEAINKLKAQ